MYTIDYVRDRRPHLVDAGIPYCGFVALCWRKRTANPQAGLTIY
jgi:hypothetical protein